MLTDFYIHVEIQRFDWPPLKLTLSANFSSTWLLRHFLTTPCSKGLNFNFISLINCYNLQMIWLQDLRNTDMLTNWFLLRFYVLEVYSSIIMTGVHFSLKLRCFTYNRFLKAITELAEEQIFLSIQATKL